MKTFNEFQEEMIDEVLDEKVVKRDKKTAQQRRKQRMEYRKNRQKIKMRMKKYRKTAGYKKLQDREKGMNRRGLTATGRNVSVQGGPGSEKRLQARKKEIRR